MVAIAIAFDIVFHELPVVVHPVVYMGRLSSALTRRFPIRHTPRDLLWSLLLLAVVSLVFVIPAVFVRRFWSLEALVLTSTFSYGFFVKTLRSLLASAQDGNLETLRVGVSQLVSRDTHTLDREELLCAGVETAVENITDSIVAPLFWFLIAGTPGAVFYRLMNTLDAMYGYRDRYPWYGKIPARIDDALNFIPARLVAMVLLLLGCVRGDDVRSGWRTFWRDRNRTASPNAGQTMSVVAGLRGICLSKPGVYALGDATRTIETRDLEAAIWYVRMAGWVAFTITLLLAVVFT